MFHWVLRKRLVYKLNEGKQMQQPKSVTPLYWWEMDQYLFYYTIHEILELSKVIMEHISTEVSLLRQALQVFTYKASQNILKLQADMAIYLAGC